MNIPNNLTTPPLWGSDATSTIRMALNRVATDSQNSQNSQNNQKEKKEKKKKRRFSWHILTMLVGFVMMIGSAGMWVYDRFFANNSSKTESEVETLLTYTEDYETVVDDDELEELTKKLKAPESDEDVSPFFGTYSYETDDGGLEMVFEYPDGDDNRVLANFKTLVDGELKQEGIVCYYGNSIYGCFKNEKKIGSKALAYFYAKKEGQRICITDGKNKQDLVYQEKEKEDDEDEEDDNDDDDDFDF